MELWDTLYGCCRRLTKLECFVILWNPVLTVAVDLPTLADIRRNYRNPPPLRWALHWSSPEWTKMEVRYGTFIYSQCNVVPDNSSSKVQSPNPSQSSFLPEEESKSSSRSANRLLCLNCCLSRRPMAGGTIGVLLTNRKQTAMIEIFHNPSNLPNMFLFSTETYLLG